MSANRIVLARQGHWSRALAEGLAEPAALFGEGTTVARVVEDGSIGGTAVEALRFGRPVIYARPLEHTLRAPSSAARERSAPRVFCPRVVATPRGSLPR